MLAFEVFPWDIWLTIIDHLEDARDVQSLFRASRQLIPLKEGYGFKIMVRKAIGSGHYDIGVQIRDIIGAILSENWEVFRLLAPNCSSMRFEVADSRLPSVITRYGLKPSNVYYSRLKYGYASPIQLLCAMFSKTKAANDFLIWTLVQGLTGYLPGFESKTAPYQDLEEAAAKRDLPLMEALLDFNKQLRDDNDVLDKAMIDILRRAISNKDLETARYICRKESSRIAEGLEIPSSKWSCFFLETTSTSTEVFEVILSEQKRPEHVIRVHRRGLIRARADSTEILEIMLRHGATAMGLFPECFEHMDHDTPFIHTLLPYVRIEDEWDRSSFVKLMSTYDVLVEPALDAFPGILMMNFLNGESALAHIYNSKRPNQSSVLKIIDHDPTVFKRMGHKVLSRIARGHGKVLRLALSDFMNRKEEVPKGEKTRMLSTILFRFPYEQDVLRACVELLLKWGANPNSSIYNHETPLMRAVQLRDVQMAVMLIGAGANVNAGVERYTGKGVGYEETALEWAVLRASCLEMTLTLLSAGAIVPDVENGSLIISLTRAMERCPEPIDGHWFDRSGIEQQSRIMVEILKRHPSLAHILFEPTAIRDEEDDVVMQDECEVGNINLVNAIVALLLLEAGRWAGGLRCCLLVGGILLGADNLSEDELGVWSCGDMMTALLCLLKELVFRHKVCQTLKNRNGLNPLQHVINRAKTLIRPNSWGIVITALMQNRLTMQHNPNVIFSAWVKQFHPLVVDATVPDK